MSDRSGCSAIELASLLAVGMCASAHADVEISRSPGEHAGGDNVVALVEALTSLGARHSWELLLDLARPWVIAVPLINTRGYIGGRRWPRQASAPRHAGCRLSHAGQVVLAAEAGHLAPVPAGLVNGTIWRGGLQPSLEPMRVIAALRQLRDHPDTPDQEILASAGPPWSLTDCDLSGDLDALAAGERVMLRQTGRIRLTGNQIPQPPAPARPTGPLFLRYGAPEPDWADRLESRAQLIIESLPDRASDELFTYLDSIRLPQDRPLPEGFATGRPDKLLIADVADLSRDGDPIRLAITLAPGSDAGAARETLLAHDGVTSETPAAYPAPLATLMRT